MREVKVKFSQNIIMHGRNLKKILKYNTIMYGKKNPSQRNHVQEGIKINLHAAGVDSIEHILAEKLEQGKSI